MVASVRAVGAVDSATPWAPGLPSGWQPGDVCYLICETTQSESVAATGWTHVTGSPLTASTTRLHVLERRMQSGDAAPTISGPSDHCVARIIGVQDAPPSGDPKDFVATATETTADTSAAWPGGTTSEDDCLILEIIATGRDAASTANLGTLTNGAYTGITERMDNWVTTGGGGGIGCVSALKATAGATGSSTATMGSTDAKALMTIAIKTRPPAAPPDPTGDVLYVDATTTGNTALASSRAVPVPAGATTADVVLVRLSRWESANPAVTPPAGFVHLGQVSAGQQKLDTYAKRLTDAESGTYTFSWSGTMWTTAQAIAWRGVDRDVDLTSLNDPSATVSSSSFATVTANGVPEGSALDWHGTSSSSGTHTPPTSHGGFTEIEDNDADVAAYQESVAAGDYTASGATCSVSADLLSSLVVLPPEPAAGGGLTGTVNQASETDTATALTKRKQKQTAQVTTTDTAGTVSRRKTRTAAQVSSTHAANPIARRKQKQTSQVAETDTAGAITRRKTKIIGQATDTSTAAAVVLVTGLTLGQAAEADTASITARRKTKGLIAASDTASAAAVGRSKRRTVQSATETASAATVMRTKRRTAASATDTSTATGVTERKIRTVQQAAETDTAREIIRPGQIARAVETDAAQQLARGKTKSLQRSTETNTAGAVTVRKSRTVAPATTTDVPATFASRKIRSVQPATETGSALAVNLDKARQLVQTIETDTARPVAGGGQVVLLEGAYETSTAFAIGPRRTTKRPDHGTTARPNTGTSSGPDSGDTEPTDVGITPRPYAGITARP